jgi:serine/threonine-protein phosphatase 5
MSSDTDSVMTITPSITETGSSDSNSSDIATEDDLVGLVPPEPVDRSQEPGAEEKAADLKTKGNVDLLAGHFPQAIMNYTQALEYQPQSAILLSNRAQAYIKIENFGLALQDADAAIAIDPSYAKAYYRRASSNFALHHFKLARTDLRAVCKLNPKSKDARSKLAEVEKLMREEAFAKAIEGERTATLLSLFDPSLIEIPELSYDGPHPTGSLLTDMDQEIAMFEPGNLPRDFVLTACQRFRDQKLIHRRYVARILLSLGKYFETLPSLLDIEVPSVPPSHDPTAPPRITVCGDTHGQYYDVLNIFEINGWPDATNPYIFNGDFVDRGSFSVEVILTFMMWKLYDPSCIYLSRGNHETKNMTRIYGTSLCWLLCSHWLLSHAENITIS